MLNDFIQAERLLRISTTLGLDALLMESFEGTEMVNGLFEFTVAVRAKRDDVKAEEIVGERVDVSLDLGAGARRSWNALVTALDEEPRLTRGLRSYVLTLRPDLWLLGQKSDCRIWQNRGSIEIAETLLSEHGLPAPDTAAIHSPPPAHEYDVQWNETDLSYLLRRLEEDGIHYWIRQENGTQRLVLADNATGWDKGADGDTGLERYAPGSTDRDHVTSWRRRFSFTPGRRAGRDWNFETPGIVPGADTPSTVKLPRNGAYELYEYPARALDAAASERASGLRMQSVEADHEALNGTSTVRTLAPGARLTLHDVAHPGHAFETAAVLSLTHRAFDTTYETGPGQPSYENAFTALPARLPATPHRATARPHIDGSQIAVIAGPEGEEIHTDRYGRVKLWFPWDRRAKKDGSDTRWVRVAQPWAGGAWGTQVIPRIGMEAVVSFEGGDPDRPIVTALVPNPQNSVPYELPANKTKMVMRSNTHKGQGFNELSFEDENNLEEVFVHAQRDMNVRILRNRSDLVHRNQSARVMGEKFERVDESSRMEVRGNLDISVGDEGNFMGASAFLQAGETFRQHPEAYEAQRKDWGEASGAVRVQAQGDLTLVAGNHLGLNATEIADLTSSGHVEVTAGKRMSMESQRLMSIQSASAMRIRAMDSIRLVNAAGGIIIDKDGNITIYGKSLKVETSGPIAMTGERIDLN